MAAIARRLSAERIKIDAELNGVIDTTRMLLDSRNAGDLASACGGGAREMDRPLLEDTSDCRSSGAATPPW